MSINGSTLKESVELIDKANEMSLGERHDEASLS